MKRLNILFAILSGTLFLYSCLGEGGHVIRVEAYPGIVTVDNSGETQEIYIDIPRDERIKPESSGSLSLGNGECVLVNYKIDLDASENKNIGNDGYYTVELTNAPTVLTKQPVKAELTDTSKVISKDERVITSFDKRYAVIKEHLFLYTNYTVEDSIPIVNLYDMSYDPDQEVKTDETGTSIYELFLRVDKVATEGKTGEKSVREVTPFSISNFINKFRPIETAKDSANMYFRINYPRSFNEDRTIINWGESEIMKIPIR